MVIREGLRLNRLYEEALDLEESARGGDQEVFGAAIEAVSVGEGLELLLPTTGVTLVVGGNNTGKSTLLKQIQTIVTAGYGDLDLHLKVVRELRLLKTGSLADVYAWLGGHSQALPGSGFSRLGLNVNLALLEQTWNGMLGEGRLWELGQAITLLADARTRFRQVEPAARRPDIALPPSVPLHYFEDNPALFDELNSYSEDIFGQGLTFDRLSGNITIRFGQTDIPVPPVDAVTSEYRQALIDLAPLSKQGDGVAGTLGLLIPLVAGRYPLALIDEPEAFLHPPQAFKLGQTLARISERHKSQLIVATHDRNIVTGVLSVEADATSVTRLERRENAVSARQIEPERLRDLWASPSLRHNNVLDGLFHRAVVIAENERDCVFYAAALEGLEGLPDGMLSSDILFLPSHGLSGIGEIARVLRSAGVPVVATVDLDALSNKANLKNMVEAVGGNWSKQLDEAYRLAVAEFSTPRKIRKKSEVAVLINAILSDKSDEIYDEKSKKSIQAVLATDNPWRDVKNYGLDRFRANRPAADELCAMLVSEGIVLVRVGELERFAPSLGVAKGANWLPAALNAEAHLSGAASVHANQIVCSILASENRDHASN